MKFLIECLITNMQEANLGLLREGFLAISYTIGQYLAEGGAYCLEANGHHGGVLFKVGRYPQ